MAFSFGPTPVIDSSLVLYLDAANPNSYSGSGTTWYDLSKSNSNGTLTNGPTFSTSASGCFIFDGVDDYTSFPNQTQFQIPTFTICSVVNPVVFDVNGTNIFTREYARLNLGISYGGVQGAYFFVQGNTGTLNGIHQTYAFTTGSWYHLTYVVDIPGNNYQMYVNGSQIFTTGSSLGTNFTSPSDTGGVLASRYAGGSNRTNIKISTFQFYNRVLTGTEIQQNYNALKTRFGL